MTEMTTGGLSETVTHPFGTVSQVLRAGPLQSGLCQLEWLEYRHGGRGKFANIARVMRPAPGLPDQAVVAAITDLVRRHEVLRTTFDADTTGQPRQVVHAVRAPVLIAVEDATFKQDFIEAPFDVAIEPPVRFGRLSDGGVIFVVAHMAADEAAVGVLLEDLAELLAARAERRVARLGLPSVQPIDQALHEREGRGRAAAESALRHWADTLPTFPPTVLPIRRCATDAGVVHAEIHSAAASLALRCLRERYSAWPASAFITATYMALAIWFNRERVGLNITWTGREMRTRNMVGSVFRDMPLLVEFGDRPTFAKALQRTRNAMLKASRRMSFDVLEFHEQAGRLAVSRGLFMPCPEAVNCMLGDLPAEPVEARPDPRTLHQLSEPETWRTNDQLRDVCSLYVSALAVGEYLDIGVAIDESYLSSDGCAAVVRLIERILIGAATNDDLTFAAAEAVAGERAAPAAPRWCRVDDVWVDLDFLGGLLREHPAVQAADVRAEEGMLVAHVIGDVQPLELRDVVLSTDNGRGAVLSPHRFVIHGTDGAAVDEGPPRHAPDGPAERALASAVAGANGLTALSITDTYLTAGGRLHMGAQVVQLLADAGYEGLKLADLRRPTSLRVLAGRLWPGNV